MQSRCLQGPKCYVRKLTYPFYFTVLSTNLTNLQIATLVRLPNLANPFPSTAQPRIISATLSIPRIYGCLRKILLYYHRITWMRLRLLRIYGSSRPRSSLSQRLQANTTIPCFRRLNSAQIRRIPIPSEEIIPPVCYLQRRAMATSVRMLFPSKPSVASPFT